MNRPLTALVLCFIMALMPLAGCVSQSDVDSAIADHDADIADKQNAIDNLTTEVSELESQMQAQDAFISALQSELSNISNQHNSTLSSYEALQSEHSFVQAQLASAEYNATAHESQIISLGTQLDLANNHIAMLNELMSNTSNTTNESFVQMSNQMAQMNEHISNLSALLNYSTARHQENVSLVSQLTIERDSLSSALNQTNAALIAANVTIAGYEQMIAQAQADAELQSSAWGLMSATVLPPSSNGAPSIVMSGTGAETTFQYNSSLQDEHWIMVEFCNVSMTDDDHMEFVYNWIFDRALNQDFSEEDNRSRRATWSGYEFEPNECIFFTEYVGSNQYNTSWSFPYFGMMTDLSNSWIGEFEMTVNVCTSEYRWQQGCEIANHDFDDDQFGPEYSLSIDDHPLHASRFIPVSVSGDPCAWNWSTSGINACGVPDDCTERSDWQSGPFISDCASVFIFDDNAYGSDNATLLNASLAMIYQDGAYSTQDVFVCVVDADILVVNEVYNELNVYVRGFGTSNAVNITGNHAEGTVSGELGAQVSYSNGLYSDINIHHWTDPNGIC